MDNINIKHSIKPVIKSPTNPPSGQVSLPVPVPSQLVRDNLPAALKPGTPKKYQVNVQTYNDVLSSCGTYKDLIAHFTRYKGKYNALNYCTLFYHLGKKLSKLPEEQFIEALVEIGAPLDEIAEGVKMNIDRYDTQGLSNIACSVAYLRLDIKMPEFLDMVAKSILKRKLVFKKSLEISLLAWAYAQCKHPHLEFEKYLCKHTLNKLESMDSAMILTIIESFDTLNYHNVIFLESIAQYVMGKLPNFDLLHAIKIFNILNKYASDGLLEVPSLKNFKEIIKKLCLERVDTISPQIIEHLSRTGLKQKLDLNQALNKRIILAKLAPTSMLSLANLFRGSGQNFR
jgi:hypothetical protein